jgi:hypothetical protein
MVSCQCAVQSAVAYAKGQELSSPHDLPEVEELLSRTDMVIPVPAIEQHGPQLPIVTLVRWVNENAFVSEVQTRPCLTFGRPVHPGFPHRLRPGTSPQTLRIPPHGGHPALRNTASSGFRSVLACIQLSPSCPFRPLHTFRFLRPARLRTPTSWIWRPSFERQRDFNPPEQRAAQRASGRRRRAHALASVRRSNCPYTFRVGSFHEDSATPRGREGIKSIRRTSSFSP